MRHLEYRIAFDTLQVYKEFVECIVTNPDSPSGFLPLVPTLAVFVVDPNSERAYCVFFHFPLRRRTHDPTDCPRGFQRVPYCERPESGLWT